MDKCVLKYSCTIQNISWKRGETSVTYFKMGMRSASISYGHQYAVSNVSDMYGE